MYLQQIRKEGHGPGNWPRAYGHETTPHNLYTWDSALYQLDAALTSNKAARDAFRQYQGDLPIIQREAFACFVVLVATTCRFYLRPFDRYPVELLAYNVLVLWVAERQAQLAAWGK